MRGLGWTGAELISRQRNDSGKLAMAARVRKETTLPTKWIDLPGLLRHCLLRDCLAT